MANKIITSHFTLNGAPATGLTPTIDIWEMDKINPAINTLVVNAASMVEIGSGWYRYNFTTYDFAKDYIMTADGGSSLPTFERYQPGANESYVEDIAYLTWEETATSHVSTDTTGLLQNQTAADATQIRIDVTSAISLIQTLLQYETNRTRIDKVLKTLTIYQDDNVSILKVFDLKDGGGGASVAEVCERLPRP